VETWRPHSSGAQVQPACRFGSRLVTCAVSGASGGLGAALARKEPLIAVNVGSGYPGIAVISPLRPSSAIIRLML
jgi:hypothetical protein